MSLSQLQETLHRFLNGRWAGAKRLQGLQGGALAFVLGLAAAQNNRPILVIAASAQDAENLHDDLSFFIGEESSLAPFRRRLHLFPSWEVLPFEKLSPHPDNLSGRLEGLYKLIEEPAPILISTPAALIQKVIPKEPLKQSYLYIVAEQNLPREKLTEHLVQWGFQNVPLVEACGDFSVRGGIIDLFSPGYKLPIRLEFDGDRLESIREFNPSSQRSEGVLEDLLLLPVKEFSLKRLGTDQIVKKLDQRGIDLDMDRREKNALLDSIKEGIPFPGIEFLLPYFYPELTSVFSYLPSNTLICLPGADRVEAEVERFAKLTWDRNAKAKEEGRLVGPPGELFLSEHECLVKHGKEPSLAPLVERLGTWDGQKVIFVAPTRGDAGRLRELLGHYEIDIPVIDQSANALLNSAKLPRAIVLG